jgi:hypothetical protein
MFAHQMLKLVADDRPPWPPKNIAYKNNFHSG